MMQKNSSPTKQTVKNYETEKNPFKYNVYKKVYM